MSAGYNYCFRWLYVHKTSMKLFIHSLYKKIYKIVTLFYCFNKQVNLLPAQHVVATALNHYKYLHKTNSYA